MAGNGFIPYGVAGGRGAAPTTEYSIANNTSEAIYYGDPVMMLASGDIGVCNSVADMNLGFCVGVFLGCTYLDPTDGTITNSQYYPGSIASDGMTATVASDPMQKYKVKWTTSGADATEVRDTIGANADIDVTNAGSTATGNSGYSLETVGVIGTTANFRIVGLVNDSEGPIGTQTSSTTYTHAIVIVQPDLHLLAGAAGIHT